MNGYIDMHTIGLAEPILTIIEMIQGDDVETQVMYGPINVSFRSPGTSRRLSLNGVQGCPGGAAKIREDASCHENGPPQQCFSNPSTTRNNYALRGLLKKRLNAQ